ILWAFSLGRAVMVGAFSIGVLLIVRQRGVLSFRDFLGAIWRPCIASLVMAFVMAEVSINFGNDVPDLLARVALGAATYIPTLLGLWVLSGRPESAEATLLTRASPKLAQLLGTPGSA